MTKRMLGVALLLLSSVSFAHFQNGAEAIIQKLDKHANIGVRVVDLTTGADLYSRYADKLFIPASNMKLFSDAAALMVLGPDYRFVNQLSVASSQLKQGELSGSVYLYLSGDPSFSYQRLQQLIQELQKWGVTRIHGNIVIESTHAGIQPVAQGWVKKDLAYSYAAPIAPVMVDANRLTVVVNPGERAGAPAIIEINDPSKTVEVTNEVVTKASPQGCGIGMVLDQNNHLTVRGCISKGQWALEQILAIHNPLLYAQGIIREQLDKMHITLDGQVILGHVPAGSLLLATDKSKPIAQILADTLKPSDNLYADSLFLHAAAVLHGSPQSWNEAQATVKNFLQEQTGIDLRGAALNDGSGLSRQDRLTPSQTVELLKFLYQKFPLTYEYIAALPISGRDGTMEKRLKKPTQQDFVRAKTGTMAGVNSLAGYIYTANGHTLAFAVFSNRLPNVNPRVSARVLIDALCSYFLEQEPGNISWAKFFKPHKRLSYQEHLTQAQVLRASQAKWRRLESEIKLALKDQPVSVVYRYNELIVTDSQADPYRVYSALQRVARRYPFAVAVSSENEEGFHLNAPVVLVSDRRDAGFQGRIWTIRKAV